MGKQNYTIVHYLNKRLKPSVVNGVLEYPVYVRVSYERKNERIKSDWIVHTCSDYNFENDKQILDLKKYETEIITDILRDSKDEHFNLSARLGHSQNYITDIFLGYMFDKNEVKNQIINFVNKKTGISCDILTPFFRLDYFKTNHWKELFEKDIFSESTKDRVKYLYMLYLFKEKHYPPLEDNIFGYKAGCIFIYHEWKNKNKEKEFLKFAKKHNLLNSSALNEITKGLNDSLLLNSKFDIRFEK